MAGGAETVLRESVADAPQLVFGLPAGSVDDVGAERLAAEAGVLVGFLAAQAVIHVQRGDAVPERAKDMPETGRVGTAGDQDGDLTAGWDEALVTDERLDALGHCLFRHR